MIFEHKLIEVDIARGDRWPVEALRAARKALELTRGHAERVKYGEGVPADAVDSAGDPLARLRLDGGVGRALTEHEILHGGVVKAMRLRGLSDEMTLGAAWHFAMTSAACGATETSVDRAEFLYPLRGGALPVFYEGDAPVLAVWLSRPKVVSMPFIGAVRFERDVSDGMRAQRLANAAFLGERQLRWRLCDLALRVAEGKGGVRLPEIFVETPLGASAAIESESAALAAA